MGIERKRRATLDDIAATAGVSRATVSRVLNGGVRSANSISADTRNSILAAATQLDYTANSQAQAMASGANKALAILVAEIDDAGASSIVAGASRRARELGYSIQVGMAGLTGREEITALRAIRGQRPKALIVAVSRTTDTARETEFGAELAAFSAAGGRISIIGENTFPYHTVLLNNAESSSALATALISRGYRKFAIVTAGSELLTPTGRTSGFLSALKENGLSPEAEDVVEGAFDRNGGYQAAGRLITRIDAVDLVFAASDAMAFGVLARLREEGIKVPGDVAIAGFDDVALSKDLTPALTTVHAPLEVLAETAIAQVLDSSTRPMTVQVAGQVILRESTPRLH
jgi:LacI family transcriptional regulator